MSYSGFNSSLPTMNAVPPVPQNPYPCFQGSQSHPNHEQYPHNDSIQQPYGVSLQPQYQNNGCGCLPTQSQGFPLTPPQEPFDSIQYAYNISQQQYQGNRRLSPSSYGPSPSVHSAPSPQQYSAEHGYGSPSPQPCNSTPASPWSTPATINQPRALHFPQDIGFYNTSFTDLYLSISQDTPPLHYVSTNTFDSYNNKPSIILYSTASKDSAPLASAKLHQLSSTVDISLSSNPCIFDENLESEGFFNSTDFFTIILPSDTQRTRFEWKEYSGELVKWLTGEQDGLKLVNADTGNVVAMWTTPQYGSMKKEGKLRFTAENRAFFGERFERMVVISLLAILERKRRKDANSLGHHLGSSLLGGGGA